MKPTDRNLARIWAPQTHPDKCSVQEHYADLLASFKEEIEPYLAANRLTPEALRMFAYAAGGMKAEAQ